MQASTSPQTLHDIEAWPPPHVLVLADRHESDGSRRRREDVGEESAGEDTTKRILLVEDYPETRAVYRTMLQYAGFQVSTAGDGAEAVRRAREELPDLILMDINLPVLSGWDAAVQLKGGADTRHIPIIGISAMTSEDAHQQAWDLGFEAYYTKPLLPRAMLGAVEEALRGRS